MQRRRLCWSLRSMCFEVLLQYNGCKWLGGVLRVEVARPDFRARFEAEEQAERALAGAEQLPSATPPGARGAEAAGEKAAAPPLRILRRDGTKVCGDEFPCWVEPLHRPEHLRTTCMACSREQGAHADDEGGA